jgi:hypothetical protein
VNRICDEKGNIGQFGMGVKRNKGEKEGMTGTNRKSDTPGDGS